jgi:iron-sulfur cluster repair protein YtfE (RIC family)
MLDTFAEMANELRNHMMKEEHVLFPYLAAMEKAVANGIASKPVKVTIN